MFPCDLSYKGADCKSLWSASTVLRNMKSLTLIWNR